MRELIERLLAERAETRRAMQAIVDTANEQTRDLTDDENGDFAARRARIEEIDARVAELEEQERRDQAAAEIRARLRPAAQVTSEPRVYERGNGASYFKDLTLSQINRDEPAQERLRRHATELRVDAQAGPIEGLPEPERRALSRTDGAGGEFVPPLWLVNEFAALARAGRPTADLVMSRPLPPGTDSINVPRVTGGTATAAQTADGAAVQSTDATTDSVSAGVKTIAGQQDMALQLIEQSPVNFDEIIFADLIADHATKVNVQVLSGTNANGQVKGILTLAGTNAVTYTDASPTVPEVYPKIADGIQRIHTGRFLPPQAHIMHPRRWAWFLSSLDTTNRPLVLPNAEDAYNALARISNVASENVVGTLQGLPVVIDPSIPTNQGAGTNEDIIVTARASDHWLFEGALRSRVLSEVLSNTIQVRLQVYSYIAFLPDRYPTSVSKITGTGLVTPTF